MHYVIHFERTDADVSGFLLFFFNNKNAYDQDFYGIKQGI